MESPQTVYIAQTLAATAFYYGIAGGFAGYLFTLSVRVLFRIIRGHFQRR